MTAVFLSRSLCQGMPFYGGRASFSLEKDGELDKGDTANSLKINMSNHAGTHWDFPRHVHPQGRTLGDYPADFFIFTRPIVISLPLTRGRYITAVDLEPLAPPPGADLIIIKTDFPHDRPEYWSHNPGLDPTAADFIKSLAPRALGVDFISLNSWPDRGPGRLAHRILLAEPEVLILEDLNLTPLNAQPGPPKRIIAPPLRLAAADGAPALVLAEF